MTESHMRGPVEPPLLDRTIGEAFDLAVERWGDEDALVVPHQAVRWTWAELGKRVDAVARGLVRLGFEPGDRLGIWATNVWQWTVTQFATSKAGIILVNINPAYRIGELEYVLNKVGCKGLVTGVEFKTSNYIAMLEGLLPELAECEPGQLQAAAVPCLRTVIRLGTARSPGMMNFGDVLDLGEANASAPLPPRPLDCRDAINIQFTSGTTGAPKGATLSHHNILNNARYIAHILRYTPQDRVLVPVPLYHCFGMVGGALCAVSTGATLVYPAESFDPESSLRAIAAERITSLYGVPTMFLAMLEHPDFATTRVDSLRTGVMAGAPCPVELMKRAVGDFHLPEITIAYGMTETSPVSFQSQTDDPIDKRVGTVGRIHPHAEAKIVDSSGGTVPIGEQGEIMTRGYLVMAGYWADDARTAEAIEDGWMHTGDLGTVDEDGWLRITGRVKDMVIRGGENIYPREIEEYLYTHPAIAEAQVFGVPDDRFGEEVAAWIQLREGESLDADRVREYCREHIAHYKIPRYIEFVDAFPMTVTGKIQKFEMRRMVAERLGLAEQETA
ncbi:MAG: AMP-binding protein [Pseudomonadota bacterium]